MNNNMGIISSSHRKYSKKGLEKHVRFEEPEEFIADCCIIFDKIKDYHDSKQDSLELKDTKNFSTKR